MNTNDINIILCNYIFISLHNKMLIRTCTVLLNSLCVFARVLFNQFFALLSSFRNKELPTTNLQTLVYQRTLKLVSISLTRYECDSDQKYRQLKLPSVGHSKYKLTLCKSTLGHWNWVFYLNFLQMTFCMWLPIKMLDALILKIHPFHQFKYHYVVTPQIEVLA